jgi:hypothetical protein
MEYDVVVVLVVRLACGPNWQRAVCWWSPGCGTRESQRVTW